MYSSLFPCSVNSQKSEHETRDTFSIALRCQCSNRARYHRGRTLWQVLVLLSFLAFFTAPASSATASLGELYSEPFRAVHGQFGGPICRTLVDDTSEEPLTLDYDPRPGNISFPVFSTSGIATIPLAAFSLNGRACNRSAGARMSFPSQQPPPRNARDVTPWAFIVEIVAREPSLDFLYVGNANPGLNGGTASAEDAQCVYADENPGGTFGRFPVYVRNLAAVRIEENLKLPSPWDSDLVLDARGNVTYFILHLDSLNTPDGTGAFCVLEKAASKDNGGIVGTSGNEGKKLSTAQIAGIAGGAMALAALIGGAITLAYWRRLRKSRQPPQPNGRPVEYKTPDGRVLQVFVDVD